MYKKRVLHLATIISGTFVSGLLMAQEKQESQKPNIIFILADDMGYECLGAYGGTYKTPNLDEMAQVGIKFNYAYAQPLSTPSRVELMTGKYNHKNYVDFGFMDQSQKTFGHLAQMAGYVTCIAGKWQLGGNSKLPAHFGFDNYSLWQLNYEATADGERYANALLEQDGKVVDRNPDMYGPDKQSDYINDFIDKNKTGPFFIYYPMELVHSPFVTTPLSDEWNEFPDARYTKDTKYFPDMMEYMDRMVGRLIDKLKNEGLYENTLIIFTGDNGTNKDITTLLKDGTTVQGGKGMSTDAGTHTALLATFGSRQAPAYECNDLVDFTDIMPTLGDAMGINIPEEWDTDGVSFYPQLVGETSSPRSWVFCHYDSFFNGVSQPSKDARRYIRNHQYKLYSTGEFYDVKNDIFEKTNISVGTGTQDAEQARTYLAEEIAKFPPWKLGDMGNPKVILPGLEVTQINWNKLNIYPITGSITNNSAYLGGNITSDGGSVIVKRGTVWSTVAGVSMNDNVLLDNTSGTGMFSQIRTPLPSDTKIYFKAFAKNLIATTLSNEKIFFTTTYEPTEDNTVFYDDFNRDIVSPGGSPAINYSFSTESDAKINNDLVLQIFNPIAASGTSYSSGSYPVSSYFNKMLSSNTGIVTWTFNVSQSKATAKLGGFDASVAGSYGIAVVLAATESNLMSPTCNGYAVVCGIDKPYTYDLVKFTGGLSANVNVTSIIVGNLPGSDIACPDRMSIRVTYDKTDDNWKLFARDDGDGVTGLIFADPSVGVSTLMGSASDNSFTGVETNYFGFLWNYGNHSTRYKSNFDNFKLSAIKDISKNNSINQSVIKVFSSHNNVQINGGLGKILSVVTITGQVIKSMIVNEDNLTFRMNDGFYILKVGAEQFKLVVKE